MQAIFVPHALYMAFFNEGRSMQDFMKLDLLASTLSAEDVAFYMACNDKPESVLPDEIAQSFTFVPFYSQMKQIEDPIVRDALEARLQKFKAGDIASLIAEDKKKMLTSDILDGDVILFTYIDAVENGSQEPGDVDLYDRLLNQVTALIPFHWAAKLPIMRAYLKASQNAIFS